MTAAFLLAAALAAAPDPSEVLDLNHEMQIHAVDGRSLELRILAGPEDTWEAVAVRVGGHAVDAPALARSNGGRPSPAPQARVPFDLLGEEMQALVLRRAFPADRRDGEDWIHVARTGPLALWNVGLWQVAEWFTGDGARFRQIAEASGLPSPDLSAGWEVRIPAALLLPALRARPRSDDGLLEYGSDAAGPWAGYRLREGEALYSSVVLRFTGRTAHDDVRSVAEELARRSGIRDVTDIPAGWLVKIPLDLLEPEFLPRSHPARKKQEAERAEMAAELAREPVATPSRRGLQGVVVVIDPGHGGRDPGTSGHGVREHEAVYDVACRLKARLENGSGARVVVTTGDGERCAVSEGDRLDPQSGRAVRTDPPFLSREPGEAPMAVNLRWYLANSVYRKAVAAGTQPERVVFLSLHADARHPSLRGAMVYVPGADFRKGSHGERSAAYRTYREYRERPSVSFTHKERVRSEAVSRKLAGALVEAFRDGDLPVQDYKPVRDRVIRGRAVWLPAVLRGNAIPAKALVEMVNLSNPADAALLGRAAERERLAGALERGLRAYYGEAAAR